MAPKRKSSTVTSESPSKKREISSTFVEKKGSYSQPDNVLATNYSTPHKSPRNLRTYTSRRKSNGLLNSFDENQQPSVDETNEEKTSDDELDTLSPTKLKRNRPPTNVIIRSPKRSRSGSHEDDSESSTDNITRTPRSPTKQPYKRIGITTLASEKLALNDQAMPIDQHNIEGPTEILEVTNTSKSFKPSRASGTRRRHLPTVAPLQFDSVLIPSPIEDYSTIRLRNKGHPPPADTLPASNPSNASSSDSPLSPHRIPQIVPQHLQQCFHLQKLAILNALRHAPDIDCVQPNHDSDCSANYMAIQQLKDLLDGTIKRGEGNSCLVLGPRGSGKSRLVEQCMSHFSADNPIVLHLSGWTQNSDKLAMREIAYQLGQQTTSLFSAQLDQILTGTSTSEDADDEVNPFLDASTSSKAPLAPTSHLPALISMLPTLNRPTVVVLDGFDLFTLHPRQALLYCLLDTVQGCRATRGSKGIIVIGITSRFDPLELEKRVKSRFSGRMIRTAPPHTLQAWMTYTETILCTRIEDSGKGQPREEAMPAEWHLTWLAIVDRFLRDPTVQALLNETFSITRDVRMLDRLLLSVVTCMSSNAPALSPSSLVDAAATQRIRPRLPHLQNLPYPSTCLLIASVHTLNMGHESFTFEMLHNYFRDQVRASTSAPIQVGGSSIGMIRCSRQVLLTAFEELVSTQAFVPTTAYNPSIAMEFVKYRSTIDREDVSQVVAKSNQVSLKKWLTRAER